MRAALYPRVSTDMQRGNYSIPSQIKAMMDYAQTRGYTLVGDLFVNPDDGQDAETGLPAFVDDFTSTELNRPGLDACLIFLKNFGFDVLLVHAVDRLARDPFYRQVIEREVNSLGARVEYVLGNYDESPEGEVRKDLDATFAKWENAKRVERANRGKKRKAEMGKYVSGVSPYGYRLNSNEESGLEVYEPEAEIVQLMFKWYVDNHLSIHQIVKKLNESGIRTYREYNQWFHSTVARMLKNTVYAGYTYYNKTKRNPQPHKRQIPRDPSEWIEMKCPVIIPVEIFELAQERLKENKERLRKQPKRFFLLAGKVFCSECSHAYTAQVKSLAGLQKGYRHKVSGGHCCNRWWDAKKLEPIIWNAVTEILFDPQSLRRGYKKMMEAEEGRQSRQIKHLEVLQVGVEKLLNKRSRLQAVYLDPDIGMSKDEYLAEKKLLEDQLKATQEEVEKIEKELSHIPSEDDLVQLEELAGRITEALGYNLDIPEAEKRRIMELLNIKVILTPDKEIKLEGFFYSPDGGILSTSFR
jgi:site-specific DNA recombinase